MRQRQLQPMSQFRSRIRHQQPSPTTTVCAVVWHAKMEPAGATLDAQYVSISLQGRTRTTATPPQVQHAPSRHNRAHHRYYEPSTPNSSVQAMNRPSSLTATVGLLRFSTAIISSCDGHIASMWQDA